MTTPADWPVLYTVQTAARILNTDPSIETGRRRLFDWFIEHDWCRHELHGHVPTAAALAEDLLTLMPVRKPNGDVWDQLLVTPAGLARLHAALGGTAPLTTTDIDSRGNQEA